MPEPGKAGMCSTGKGLLQQMFTIPDEGPVRPEHPNHKRS